MAVHHSTGMVETPLVFDGEISVPVHDLQLGAALTIPRNAKGLAILAHNGGGGRFSPRNRVLAEDLNASGYATMLLDLLTADEELADRKNARYHYDIPLLADRLTECTQWASADEGLGGLPIMYLAATIAGAVALNAATRVPDSVKALALRSGRPDLAGGCVGQVQAPTLLIVGELDAHLTLLNQNAMNAMRCVRELRIVPEASHLLEEEGALATVATLACEWFDKHISGPVQEPSPTGRGTHN
jgi:pimeloyl-ACP methyl ester carboxylesterase